MRRNVNLCKCGYLLCSSSGTEEEESELLSLLQQLADLAHECGYNPPRSTLRSARQESTKSRGNSRREGSRARARRPEVVDPREEAALAAFDASLTGNGEKFYDFSLVLL